VSRAALRQLWLQVGGTAIDTAHDYRDEPDVATGIAEAGVAREKVFITTKISCETYEKASSQIDDNLRELQMSTVDVTLIHFPRCWGSASVAETWRALEDAKTAGKTRAIGVSNFVVSDLQALKASARDWPPAINQCSLSVGYHDDATMRYCDENKIVYMAFSPLCGGSNGSSCTHGSVMSLPQVQAVAASHNVSAAQVALKWIVQQGRPLATAVARADYMREDLDLWSWGNLTDAEVATLTAI
jgi:diketogulonate reductase-like aldo/keto reductase